MEAWAGPSPTVEPVISRSLPGGGYLSTTRAALDRMTADLERVRSMAGTVKHQSEIDAERREREAEGERQRQAAPALIASSAHYG
jgi:hypothetical protein